MEVALKTTPDRLLFYVRGELFAVYSLDAPLPGFIALYAPGRRCLTQNSTQEPSALTIFPESVSRIVSEELMARRGAHSVGFQQICRWVRDGHPLLTEERTVRIASGRAEGAILDLTLCLKAPDKEPALIKSDEMPLLRLAPANTLLAEGGGQMRSSEELYGAEAIHGYPASWCACVGVVEGETVGLSLFAHPDNFGHPPLWSVTGSGAFGPAPFAREDIRLEAGKSLTLQYRLLMHRGYVEMGWTVARMREFTREGRER